MTSVRYWNPYTNKLEIESVYGDKAIRFLYENRVGQELSGILAQPFFSKIYGRYQDSSLSKKKIPGFIERFKIEMDEFEKGPFHSFNEFFTRHFLPGKRTFCLNPQDFPAFAEGRYLAFEKTTPDIRFPVKGKYLSPRDLIQDNEKAAPFMDGPIFIARLCPTDYHRFHFPDEGEITKKWSVPGPLQSVNPIALKFKKNVFITNERQVTILKTKNFGKLAYIEVGALFVGKIVQTYTENYIKRGEEKGCFLFGASTVIVLGEPGAFTPSPDLLERSSKGLETFIKLGDKIGQ